MSKLLGFGFIRDNVAPFAELSGSFTIDGDWVSLPFATYGTDTVNVQFSAGNGDGYGTIVLEFSNELFSDKYVVNGVVGAEFESWDWSEDPSTATDVTVATPSSINKTGVGEIHCRLKYTPTAGTLEEVKARFACKGVE